MSNIRFKIGQPNTGKSHGFKAETLKDKKPFKGKDFKYKIIPVSGGVGNEYKGLQNTDLSLSYDAIKTSIRFGEFLQMLMSSIIQPAVPHVIFLDDFHNQDISSLLSEYTPLFKGQQKASLLDHENFIKAQRIDLDLTVAEDFETAEVFIAKWNKFIEDLVEETKDKPTLVAIPVTNRISGADLKLIFPANFYLFGAANFNEKTLNIFADWNDRAELEIIDPIDVQEEAFVKTEESEIIKTDEGRTLKGDEKDFIQCCLTMNINLKDILHEENIFDHEKYCFGIWKVIDEDKKIISGDNQVKTIKFFFSMIKNSLIYNNRNSHINTIGWELIKSMKEDPWFQKHILNEKEIKELNEKEIKELEKLDIENDDENGTIFKVLHSLNIYDN